MGKAGYAITALLLAGSGGLSMADEAAHQLPTIVVTATRIEQPIEQATTSISVISAEDIDNRQTQSVADTLRDVPGVDVSQSGSPGTTSSVFIRGAEADQTLILVDGVQVNSATLGGFNFGNIMTDDVGRIEVLRGAGGTLYGSEAMGGVINIISKKGEGEPHFSLASAGGNIGLSSQLATAAGTSGIVSYSAALGYVTSAGYRQVNDDFSNLTSALRVDVTPIEHGTLRAFWRSADSSLGLADNNIGAGYGTFLDPNAREHDEFYLAKGEWEHTPLPALTYRISGAYSRTVNVFDDAPDPQVLTSPNFYPPYFLTHFRVPNELATGEGQVNYSEGAIGITTAGYEFKEESGRLKSVSLDFPATPDDRFVHSRGNHAGYVQQQLHFLDDRLIAIGGFRADGNQDFGREVSSAWSIGYLQDWDGTRRWATRVKGGYAEGFRAPTFNELLYPRSGNLNLEAETSSEYNGSLEQHLGAPWLSVASTYFTRRTKGLIQFAPVAQCPGAAVSPGTFFAGCNLGRADVRGVETALDAGPFLGLSLRGSYTYLDWDVLGGSALLRRPHNRMAASLNYERRRLVQQADRFNANFNVVFKGERHDLDPTTFAVVGNQPAYTRADLALRYDLPLPGSEAYRIGGFARVQNLFDRNYQEVRGFKSPPINVLAGAQLTF